VSLALDDLKERAVIRVADNGIGMSPKMIKSLFKPFMQADESLDRSQGGLGLGLALVKGLGGTPRRQGRGIQQRPGGRVRVYVYLPLSTKPSPLSKRMKSVPNPRVKNCGCWLIEDIKDVAEMLKLLLLEEGHEVMVANDGIKGVKMAKEYRPDVVLCDIGLPGMDGYQVARAFAG
jgi:hypothetical protein